MAERFLALLFMLSFVFQSSLAAERITTKNWPKFADIEWGSSEEVVKEILEKKGYECQETARKTGRKVLVFTGMLAGKKAEGTCGFTQNKLVFLRIVYRTKMLDSEGKITLDGPEFSLKLIEILVKKYGNPRDISDGKKLSYGWVNADNPGQMPILLEIKTGESIAVMYFSLAYHKRAVERREQSEKSEKDF